MMERVLRTVVAAQVGSLAANHRTSRPPKVVRAPTAGLTLAKHKGAELSLGQRPAASHRATQLPSLTRFRVGAGIDAYQPRIEPPLPDLTDHTVSLLVDWPVMMDK